MDRIEMLLNHELFLSSLQKINIDEKDRIYCCHGIGHLLDVARMAYIDILEKGLDIDRELIYAAALLHDIGRWRQYEEGIPHDSASAELAVEIMSECGFSPIECQTVKEAISRHRSRPSGYSRTISDVLYQADKKSRLCFLCDASGTCYWTEDQKNRTLYR